MWRKMVSFRRSWSCFCIAQNQNLYGETKKDVGIVFYLALKYINGVETVVNFQSFPLNTCYLRIAVPSSPLRALWLQLVL